ncbi:MAG: class II fumarate hydratase [Polyangiaceae bacterium]|nr:class II fumarate hydratase [Polyangiaceae bacterium]
MSSSKGRVERDALGEIEVAPERLWGAQTERSLRQFRIGEQRMPRALVQALVRVKKVVALTNAELGELAPELADAIVRAADEVLDGRHEDEFPLSVWQTGSGTQTNMNVNEVLANRASELLGGSRGDGRCVHPNDHVNRGQSSNDVFPTAMSIAACDAVLRGVLPSVRALARAIEQQADQLGAVVKLGRTHLMDATPLTVRQELGAWAAALERDALCLERSTEQLGVLALGATAVGTGLSAHAELSERAVAALARETGLPLCPATNKFDAIAMHGGIVHGHGALRALATTLMKVANDVRLLASGPRGGLGELRLRANEPGSSIMPGKVNPTQAESLCMVAARVLGNDVTVGIAGASGQLQLNVMKPLLAFTFLESTTLLTDGCHSFRQRCIESLSLDEGRIQEHLERSLMLVTALVPHIGYDRAAAIAKRAYETQVTLRQAATDSGAVSAEDFDRWVRPEHMV